MDYILQSRRSKRRNNSYLLWNKGYFLFFVHIKYAHFFEACAGQDDRSMHLKETRRAQNGGKAFLQFQNKRPAWAFAQGVEAFVLLRDDP